MTSIAPEPPAPPSAHGRAVGLTQARTPRLQIHEVPQGRRLAHARPHRQGAQEQVSRCTEYAAHWKIDVGMDSESAPSGRHGSVAAHANDSSLPTAHEAADSTCRQLSILSEVSIVGQEFGWAHESSLAKHQEARALNDSAAGVFGMQDEPSERRSGRDTAMELRRFMQSVDASTSDEDIDRSEAIDCPRSPAQLEGYASIRQKKTRPASAPCARRLLETELRREIAASKARTDHMTKAMH